MTDDTPPEPLKESVEEPAQDSEAPYGYKADGTPRQRRPYKRRDSQPGSRSKKHEKLSTAQIQTALTELLSAPAGVYALCDAQYPADHVVNTAPGLAEDFAKLSEQNAWLRDKLERFAAGEMILGSMILVAMLTMSVARYIIPQLSYFGVIPRHFAEQFGGQPLPSPDESISAAPQNPSTRPFAPQPPPTAVSGPVG